MSPFSRHAGTSTLGWRACRPLRIRVSMSAIGSDVVILLFVLLPTGPYQLALITPGTSPARASFRKQIRHSLNLRRNPRGRPQRKQRLRCRQLSLGVLAAFATASRSSLAILAVVAIVSPKSRAERHAEMLQQRHALGIGFGGGRNANIHSLEFLDF